MFLRAAGAALAFVFASAAVIGAQAQAPEQEPVPILRAVTRLVQVEVVVRDKAGRPLPGLKQGDFQIFEDGKPQEIRFFTAYRHNVSRLADLPPGMSSNRPDIVGPRRGVTVVLIDTLNTAWEHRARALINLRKFLDAAQPDDRIAVYTLSDQLRVFHDFTGDARALRRKLEQHGGTMPDDNTEALLNALLPPEAAALLKWQQATERELRTVARVEATLDTLEKVANHLGSTPGWKSLVWISSGIPLQVGMNIRPGQEVRGFEREFNKTVRALTNSNVAVYPVDPQGLQELPLVAKDARTAVQPGLEADTKSMLTQLADRTGGRAYVDQNDILGALKDVTDAAQASYSLAYYPSDSAFDGKYRKIDVRVKKPDLRVSHRKGYYALDTAEVKRDDPQKAMQAAALDPLDNAVIGIDAGLQAANGASQLLARIDTGELLWADKGAFEVQTSVGVFQYDGDGRQLASFVDKIEFPCDASKAELLSRYGLSYSRNLTLAPTAARLRLVVRSARTGAIGSLTLPINR